MTGPCQWRLWGFTLCGQPGAGVVQRPGKLDTRVCGRHLRLSQRLGWQRVVGGAATREGAGSSGSACEAGSPAADAPAGACTPPTSDGAGVEGDTVVVSSTPADGGGR